MHLKEDGRLLNTLSDKVLVAWKKSDPSTLVIEFNDEQGSASLSDYMACVPNEGRKEIAPIDRFQRVAFVPRSRIKSINNEEETQIDKVSTLLDVQGNADEELDAVWRENKLGWAVYSTAIVFATCGESIYVPSSALSYNLSVPDAVVGILTSMLEEDFGEGNVFVSHQVIPAQEMFVSWLEFRDQASERMVNDEKYWRHQYDTQYHPAGELYLPIYAIPISIMKKWDRTVDMSEYAEFMEQLLTNAFDGKVLDSLLRQIHCGGTWLSKSLCSRSSLLDVIDRYRQTVYLNAAREHEYFLPGQPLPLRVKIARKLRVLSLFRKRKCGTDTQTDVQN